MNPFCSFNKYTYCISGGLVTTLILRSSSKISLKKALFCGSCNNIINLSSCGRHAGPGRGCAINLYARTITIFAWLNQSFVIIRQFQAFRISVELLSWASFVALIPELSPGPSGKYTFVMTISPVDIVCGLSVDLASPCLWGNSVDERLLGGLKTGEVLQPLDPVQPLNTVIRQEASTICMD